MKNNYDLIVIGGGSAGIAASISAYDNGIKNILILEKDSHLGGILIQCIHNGFGVHRYKEELTGPEYAEKNINELNSRKISYKTKAMVLKVTKDLKVHYSSEADGYQVLQAKAIVFATGCSERTRGNISIPGDRVSGVMTAGLAQRYLNIDGYLVGRKVFILGSGDIGLIMARRMTLEGAKVIGVAEIMPYSNGLARNIAQCLDDFDIPLYLNHTVKRIIGKNRVEKIILSEVDSNFNYIEGTDRVIEVDTLLLSVGLIPSIPLLEDIGVELDRVTKGPIVNEAYMTSIEGIFICGNSLHVHDLVDYVSEEADRVGISVSKYLNNKLKKSNDILTLVSSNTVSYLLPQRVDLANIEEIEVSFRVKVPSMNSKVNILIDGEVIKTLKIAFLLPAEMVKIKIPKTLLKPGELKLEVENA